MSINPCKPPSSLGSEQDWNDGVGNASFNQIYDTSDYNDTATSLTNLSQTSPDILNATNFRLAEDPMITNPIWLTIAAGSIIGNLTILLMILVTPRFHRPRNYMIVNLFFTSVLVMGSTIFRDYQNSVKLWNYTTTGCQLLAVIHRIPVPVFSLTTMVISFNRGRVARDPSSCLNAFSPLWKILFMWSYSVLIVIPLAFTRVYDGCNPFAYKCAKVFLLGQPSVSILYGVLYLLAIHIIPASILIRELIKTWKMMNFLKQTNTNNLELQLRSGIAPYRNNRNTILDNRLRLLRKSQYFTINFLTVWLPYGLFQFPVDLPKEILPGLLQSYLQFYFYHVKNLALVQVAITPVLVFGLSYDLCTYLKRIICNFEWRRILLGCYHYRHNYNNPRLNSCS